MSSNAWLSLIGGLVLAVGGSFLIWSILRDQSDLVTPFICGVFIFLFAWGAIYSAVSDIDRNREIDKMLEEYKKGRLGK
jgi:drug/metabolite transporter superfamily protein YnfA